MCRISPTVMALHALRISLEGSLGLNVLDIPPVQVDNRPVVNRVNVSRD